MMIKRYSRAAALLALLPLAAMAQVPVDEDGNVIGQYEDETYENEVWESDERPVGEEGIPLLTPTELDELIGPIALYPDDLLAVVLPASTYPLQVVQAQRVLDDLADDPDLQPDPDWDDSIVALLNYPEVLELLNEDLDWTWRLGEAVVAQQEDVVAAVEDFRNRAYAAGNLQSDEYQTVSEEDGFIEITPVSEEVIYVPYYEPAEVVVYQPRRVYYYYPDPCPVYYYPYPSYYSFDAGFRSGYFWGVTTAYTIGWNHHHLRVFHHSYRGHPYYGRSYWDRWWYRRPSISIYNNYYVRNYNNYNRYTVGDHWRSNRSHRLRYTDQRITRSVGYPGSNRDADRRRNDLRRDGTLNRQHNVVNRTTSVDRQRDANTRGRTNTYGTANRGNATSDRGNATADRRNTTTRRDGNVGTVNRDRPSANNRNNDRVVDSNRWSTRDRREDVVRGDDRPRTSSSSRRETGPSASGRSNGNANSTYGRQEPGAQFRQRPPQGSVSTNNRPRPSAGNGNRGNRATGSTNQRREPAAQFRQRPPQSTAPQSNRPRVSSGSSSRPQAQGNNRPRQSASPSRPRPNAAPPNRAPAASSNQRSQRTAPARDEGRRRRN